MNYQLLLSLQRTLPPSRPTQLIEYVAPEHGLLITIAQSPLIGLKYHSKQLCFVILELQHSCGVPTRKS
ncbi:hypothetical protein F8M41_022675 [Gigaspora margarita]|uniref:Uncharacterized protein n=1 Tax=Gigaspora margarita TaxID=4874 RepID=A0A8H4ETS0_GIGMA|nr:hypothetical protein F8M41_022675 [Gigaspora margarita]